MAPAPGADGRRNRRYGGGLDAASIADQTFAYGVDYLGVALRQAADAWEVDHPGTPLDSVDVIAHSTGGLIARTYLQSAAYAGVFDGTRKLPAIEHLIMVGVPNRGAAKAWNPMHDNWVTDPVFQVVLSKIIDRAYQKVLNGAVISGPDGAIGLASLTPPQCLDLATVCFVNQYVPTIRALLATYDFIDFGAGFTNVNGNPDLRNTLVLDLNAGLDLAPAGDPNAFADLTQVTAIYGTNGGLVPPAVEIVLGPLSGTPTATVERTGPDGGPLGFRSVARFSEFLSHDAAAGEVWYDDVLAPVSGDGTVPIASSAEQFLGDDRVTLRAFTQGGNTTESVSHTDLMFNRDVQELILQTLGADFESTDISSGKATPGYGVACAITGCVNFTLDPVEGFLVDGLGRRLGFSAATGPRAEIPGSVWFGGADGTGWIFAPPTRPLTLDLAGLGADYLASVTMPASGAGRRRARRRRHPRAGRASRPRRAARRPDLRRGDLRRRHRPGLRRPGSRVPRDL